MTPRRSALAYLAAGLAFGVAMALLKGEGAGTRNVLGNLSAPWLVLPFLAGRGRGSAAAAATLGAGTCVLSFVGFYGAAAGAFGMVNSHTIAYDLGFVASGAVAGPMFGALGFWWRRRRSILAGCAVGLAFVAEPFAQVWVWRLYGASVDATSVFRHPAIFGVDGGPDGLAGRAEHGQGLVATKLHDLPSTALDALTSDRSELGRELGSGLVAPFLGEEGVAPNVGDKEGPDDGSFIRLVDRLPRTSGLGGRPIRSFRQRDLLPR